jgi:hypothetical protein
MCNQQIFFVDGTFDYCAQYFLQMFTIHVNQKEKRRKEGGCGWPGKVPRSPAAHKRKKRKKPTARYLIDQYGEKGKAIKKKKLRPILFANVHNPR